ncbi:MAG: hypothetical protein R3E83_15445 [Burkholderiaceae bacterium]
MTNTKTMKQLACAAAIAAAFATSSATATGNESTAPAKQTATDGMQKSKEMMHDGKQAVTSTARDAKQATMETARDAKQATVETAKDAKQATMETARDAKQATVEAARDVKQGAQSMANKTEQAAGQAADKFADWSERKHLDRYTDEKDRLEEQLKTVSTRDGYRAAIEKAGYMITSINKNDRDELEYEIVKGDHSYEVQLDFDDGAPRASSIDVASNLWRAESTERAMEDKNYRPSGVMFDKDRGAAYSDRTHVKDWSQEKERLERMLTTGMTVKDFTGALQREGYMVTSINDREPDYLEFEIVKAKKSFEVHDRPRHRPGQEVVDVTTNMWQSEATEKALVRSERYRSALPALRFTPDQARLASALLDGVE